MIIHKLSDDTTVLTRGILGLCLKVWLNNRGSSMNLRFESIWIYRTLTREFLSINNKEKNGKTAIHTNKNTKSRKIKMGKLKRRFKRSVTTNIKWWMSWLDILPLEPITTRKNLSIFLFLYCHLQKIFLNHKIKKFL